AFIMPPPSEIFSNMVERSDVYFQHSIFTVANILLGFGLSVITALVLAPVMIYSKFAYKVMYPMLVMSQVVPKVALAPLFIIWLGFGASSKILMAFLIAFFPILIDALGGLSSVRPG